MSRYLHNLTWLEIGNGSKSFKLDVCAAAVAFTGNNKLVIRHIGLIFSKLDEQAVVQMIHYLSETFGESNPKR